MFLDQRQANTLRIKLNAMQSILDTNAPINDLDRIELRRLLLHVQQLLTDQPNTPIAEPE